MARIMRITVNTRRQSANWKLRPCSRLLQVLRQHIAPSVHSYLPPAATLRLAATSRPLRLLQTMTDRSRPLVTIRRKRRSLRRSVIRKLPRQRLMQTERLWPWKWHRLLHRQLWAPSVHTAALWLELHIQQTLYWHLFLQA